MSVTSIKCDHDFLYREWLMEQASGYEGTCKKCGIIKLIDEDDFYNMRTPHQKELETLEKELTALREIAEDSWQHIRRGCLTNKKLTPIKHRLEEKLKAWRELKSPEAKWIFDLSKKMEK